LLALIVEALQAVHRSGIVHCDLNLENVLVSSDLSCAWLIDYGGAYDLLNTNSSRQDRQMTGTPGYVAPERVQDPSAPPTPQADVFSLGVILFQTLTGQHPYSDNSHKKTPVQLSDSLRLDWNRAEALLLAKAVPSALRELVGKMLLPDPKTRIPLREVIAASSCGLAAIARKI
jgi:serine/threonine protein kinase